MLFEQTSKHEPVTGSETLVSRNNLEKQEESQKWEIFDFVSLIKRTDSDVFLQMRRDGIGQRRLIDQECVRLQEPHTQKKSARLSRHGVLNSLRLSLILQDISPRSLHNSDLNLNKIGVHKEKPGAALHIQKYNFPHVVNTF